MQTLDENILALLAEIREEQKIADEKFDFLITAMVGNNPFRDRLKPVPVKDVEESPKINYPVPIADGGSSLSAESDTEEDHDSSDIKKEESEVVKNTPLPSEAEAPLKEVWEESSTPVDNTEVMQALEDSLVEKEEGKTEIEVPSHNENISIDAVDDIMSKILLEDELSDEDKENILKNPNSFATRVDELIAVHPDDGESMKKTISEIRQAA